MYFRSSVSTLFLAALLSAHPAFSQAPSDAREHAQRLVFLIQYIGTDYPGAVEAGKVINSAEYQEITDFAASAEEKLAAIAGALPPSTANDLAASLARLRERIATREAAARIRQETDHAVPVLIDAFDLKPVPRQLPRTNRAAELYRESCATCHGESGDGAGPDAAGLEPPPAIFTDSERMANAAPYVFYNAITFGIDGTAMASFRESFDEQERWDLAFFLWTFVAPVEPPAEGSSVRIPLRELAVRSTEELAEDVGRQVEAAGGVLDPAEARALVASLRAHPRPITDHEERLARVRRHLLKSLSLLDEGKLEDATEIVTTAYLDDFEPLEPQIDRLDPGVRQRFERSLVDFRQALRAGEAERARGVAGELLAAVSDAEQLFGDGAGTLQTIVVLGAFGVILLGGLIWMVGVGNRRGEG